jgi:molybdopterin synthase catalytic subunit
VREGLSIRLSDAPIDPGEAFACVADGGAGGAVVFAGTVRDHSSAGSVTGLEYEAWEERAHRQLAAIGEELFARWPVRKVAIWHRTGRLEVGEVSVVVAASAPHRDEAFAAARHGIERIKQDVPIWKKESLVDGEARWVMGS